MLQLRVPGIVAFRAVTGATTVGMTLWYVHGDVGYYHLAAFDEVGYRTGASYALMSASMEQLADEISWLDLGGAAGLYPDASDGLARFKRGWSTGTRIAYLCAAILDGRRYDELVNATGRSGSSYFPAYRRQEAAE
jgi:hypothetical protein